jgi:hypothetical protein
MRSKGSLLFNANCYPALSNQQPEIPTEQHKKYQVGEGMEQDNERQVAGALVEPTVDEGRSQYR